MLGFCLEPIFQTLKIVILKVSSFLGNEEKPETISDPQEKTFILDVQVVLKRKGKENTEIVNVEIQQCANVYFSDRTISYGCRILSKQLKKGDSYKDLPKVYCIAFCARNLHQFSHPEAKDLYYHECIMMRRYPPHLEYSDILECIIIELAKIPKIHDDIVDLKGILGYFIREAKALDKAGLKKIESRGEVIGESMAIPIKRLLDLSEDEQALRLIEAREKQRKDKQAEIMTAIEETRQEGLQKLQEGRQEGRQEGLQEGLQKGQQKLQETALRLIEKGIDITIISESTRLPIDEIKALKNK